MPSESGLKEKGLVDGADRILKELLRTPKFREAALILLRSIDPPAARGLVRTLFWEDPVLFMSIFGAIPDIINACLEAAAETGEQLSSLPPVLLQDFLERVVKGIDGAALGEAFGGLVSMLLSLRLGEADRLKESLRTLASDVAGAYREKTGGGALLNRLDDLTAGVAERAKDETTLTHAVVRSAAEAVSKNPDFVENVMRPLLSPLLEAAGRRPAGKKKAAGKKAAAGKSAGKSAGARKRSGG